MTLQTHDVETDPARIDFSLPKRREAIRMLARVSMSDAGALFGWSLLALLLLLAIMGPTIAPYSPTEVVRDQSGTVARLLPPQPNHLLGTTAFGRDVFSQMLYGVRPVMLVGLICAILPTTFGFALGLVAGYYRGLLDAAISRIVEIWYAMPTDAFAIVLLVMLRPTLATLIFAISITSWRRVTRVVRNHVLTLGDSSFVKASRVSGASSAWIIARHLTPLTIPLALVYIPIGFATAVLSEASLSFLGFGDPSLVTWGGIMRDAFSGGAMSNAWWWIVPPGVAITLTALSVFLIARPLERALDPQIRDRRT